MFKYEMHVHSLPSRDGAPIEKHIDFLKSRGFSGLVITNHFLWGATNVDRTLPWPEFVEFYRKDYEAGRRYGEARDFDVLFGVEEHIGGGREILVYGLGPDFFLSHPQLQDHELSTYSRLVRAAGGILLQAHPFRMREYITEPGPVPDLSLVDGIEVFNASNQPGENELAAELAQKHSFILSAGSDAHSGDSAGRAGIASPRRLRSEAELAGLLRSGEVGLIK